MCKIDLKIRETDFAQRVTATKFPTRMSSGIDVALPKTYEPKPGVPPTLRILIKRVKFSANSEKSPKFRLEIRKRADFLEMGWISHLASWWLYS